MRFKVSAEQAREEENDGLGAERRARAVPRHGRR